MRAHVSTLAAVALLTLSGCATTVDMTDFTGVTLPVGMQAPAAVPVQMAAFDDLRTVQRLCSQADKRQQAAQAVGGMYLACAITHKDGCLIVTWANTAYQVLGHEAMHCLWTPRTRAGQVAGVPAHFITPKEAQ